MDIGASTAQMICMKDDYEGMERGIAKHWKIDVQVVLFWSMLHTLGCVKQNKKKPSLCVG